MKSLQNLFEVIKLILFNNCNIHVFIKHFNDFVSKKKKKFISLHPLVIICFSTNTLACTGYINQYLKKKHNNTTSAVPKTGNTDVE